MNRLYNLDYLRGGAAFGILIYHYLSWTFGIYSSETVIAKIGVYGVSIFYVLSGLTLFYVYESQLKSSFNDVKKFFIKRFFRLFPLMWLVMILTITISQTIPDLTKILLNFSGLFGLYWWNAAIGTGVWSIANELVFYLFFPFFMIVHARSKTAFYLLNVVVLGIYIYFAFFVLDTDEGLVKYWRQYTNPMNQLFLFSSGLMLGSIFNRKSFSQVLILALLVFSVLVFSFYPTQGPDTIHIVTGWSRLVLSATCIVLCFCFFKLEVKLPTLLHKFFIILGESSYSLYLLHPILWSLFGIFLKHTSIVLPDILKIFIGAAISLSVSYLVYLKFEKYFIAKGKKFLDKNFPQVQPTQ